MDIESYKNKIHILVEKLKTNQELFSYLQKEVLQATSDNRIDNIERYLGLDYKLDTVKPAGTIYNSLDYSFIREEGLRDKLYCDFREMMRYRYGTRSHKIDFEEYCRYAHFQLEALTNYFMKEWSLNSKNEIDIEIAKQNIRENWTEKYEFNLYGTISTIDDIPYQTKVRPILQFLNIKNNIISHPQYIYYNVGDVIDNIRKARNACSHRGTQYNQIIQNAIDEFEHHKTLRYSSSGKSQQYDFSANWEVKYYLWLRSTPWDDIISVLLLYTNSIVSKLQ